VLGSFEQFFVDFYLTKRFTFNLNNWIFVYADLDGNSTKRWIIFFFWLIEQGKTLKIIFIFKTGFFTVKLSHKNHWCQWKNGESSGWLTLVPVDAYIATNSTSSLFEAKCYWPTILDCLLIILLYYIIIIIGLVVKTMAK